MPAKFSRYTLHTYIDVRLRQPQTEAQTAQATELYIISSWAISKNLGRHPYNSQSSLPNLHSTLTNTWGCCNLLGDKAHAHPLPSTHSHGPRPPHCNCSIILSYAREQIFCLIHCVQPPENILHVLAKGGLHCTLVTLPSWGLVSTCQYPSARKHTIIA